MTNVILCGGSGTRLWPLSRSLMPKQFVKLFDDRSLFQLTVERNSKICEQQLIVSNTEQYFLAVDQLDEIDVNDSNYLLEPLGRDTAAAIALACFSLPKDELVLVTPSDHLIENESVYAEIVGQAKVFAQMGNLVTFGITPRYAETGFGYIEAEGNNVLAFHEKPEKERVEQYLKKGNYYWNSGMFCFAAGVFLDELRQYAPAIYTSANRAYVNAKTERMIRIREDDMLAIPKISVDYAVMEHSQNVKMVVADIGWSDVGSFDALSEVLPNDENNNFIVSDKEVALIDMENTIVVDTQDALLVAKKGSSQKIKDVVLSLQKRNAELTQVHRLVHRPWGTYEVLYPSEHYKIKRIVVYPGKRLSLQKHLHRNEHWVVVKGEATVQVGDEVKVIGENESTYIKQKEQHRLSNETDKPVIIIEVQVGSYVGEDDIIRLEDDYRRTEDA